MKSPTIKPAVDAAGVPITPHSYVIEQERYELFEQPRYRFAPTRRELFKFAGAGLIVALVVSDACAQQGETGGGRRQRGFGGGQGPSEISAWIHIGEDGAITFYTGKAELGQDARTSLTQAVADELRTPATAIKHVMGDTALCPYDAGTFGSRTTPGTAPPLRKAAAAAREVLIDLAAEQWKCDRGQLSVADGAVHRADNGQTLGFGALTQGKKLMQQVRADIQPTPPDKWTSAGKPMHKLNAADIVSGRLKYCSDVKLPGMLHAKVVRPASYGAELASADTGPASAMPGVVVVKDGSFLACAAPTAFGAQKAAAAIKAEWKSRPQVAAKELFDHLRKTAQGYDGTPNSAIAEGLRAAAKTIDVTYTVAYIAHVPLEPRAAVAQWEGDNLTVWCGTSRPFGVRDELAQAFRLPAERVHVITPDTGASYGGKHTGEAAAEAARIAKAAGKPVKVVWSREEEFTWAYFRPAGVIDVKAGAKADGTLTAWEFHNVNSGGAGLRGTYDCANQHTAVHNADSPLRQGSYRSLAACANHFARESAMDELARALQMDPVTFRLKNLKDERQIAVLKAAAEKFGWPHFNRPRVAAGIACGFDKNSYVATAALVSLDAVGGIKVERIVTAFDCGATVNPAGLRNQIEGATSMGIGGALYEAIDFANGKINNPRLSAYKVPRFMDVPPTECVLIDRKDVASAGAGETPLTCVAPAIANAIAAATGRRIRQMPLAPGGKLRT